MTESSTKDRGLAIYGWIALTAFLAFNVAAFIFPLRQLPYIAVYMIGGLAVIGIAFGIWGGVRLARSKLS